MTTQVSTAGSDALTGAQQASLRAMLEQQRDFRIDQLAQLDRPGPPGPLGSADREVYTSLVTGARASLHDVRQALGRMDDGSYGRCTTCGDRLDIAQLTVLPQAAACMTCQQGVDE